MMKKNTPVHIKSAQTEPIEVSIKRTAQIQISVDEDVCQMDDHELLRFVAEHLANLARETREEV
jgi:hypothetical protein